MNAFQKNYKEERTGNIHSWETVIYLFQEYVLDAWDLEILNKEKIYGISVYPVS